MDGPLKQKLEELWRERATTLGQSAHDAEDNNLQKKQEALMAEVEQYLSPELLDQLLYLKNKEAMLYAHRAYLKGMADCLTVLDSMGVLKPN